MVIVMLALRNRIVKALLLERLENIQRDVEVDLKIRRFYSLYRNSHVKKNELYIASFLKMHIDTCVNVNCVCKFRN